MGSEDREAVTTMATTTTWRPSALASACTPFPYANAARAHVLGHFAGQPAVSVRVQTAPIFGLLPGGIAVPGGEAALQLNNSIGTAAAAPAAAASAAITLVSTVPTVPVAPRNEKAQAMVKGGDARGIPPRGTPV